jgi:hypothetical protein
MPTTLHPPRTRVALAAVACLASLLAGCGKGGDSSAAAGGSAAPASGSGSAGTLDQQYSAWEAKFRSCLSDKGFDLPKEAGKIDFGDRQPAYEQASAVCTKKIGKPPTGKEDAGLTDQQKKEKQLKVLQCLRDQGYQVTDRGNGQAPLIQAPDGVSVKDSKKCFHK